MSGSLLTDTSSGDWHEVVCLDVASAQNGDDDDSFLSSSASPDVGVNSPIWSGVSGELC